MKKFLKVFVCIILFLNGWNGTVHAQMVYVADSMFRVKLTNLGFGTCMVGDSIDSSCPAVQSTTSLTISSGNISSIVGIEAFVNLQSLDCSVNLLTTLPPLVDSLMSVYFLDCSSNQLTSLPDLPPQLGTLVCNSNQLTSLPYYPPNLYSLFCSNNHLANLSPFIHPMLYLDCGGNLLTSLPPLPDIISLSCGLNQLDSLPPLPNSMDHLFCYENLLTSLPALPASLTTLDCSSNHIIDLPALPSALTFLSCHDNQLATLPSLPDSLAQIQCENNHLTNLPTLPDSLTTLDCGNNQLTSLPALPTGLNFLTCTQNSLDSLPGLPGTLTNLQCGSNHLTNLPALPPIMTNLDCNNNQLTILPALPASLNLLICTGNQLTSLPSLPDSLIFLNCAVNQLTEVPALPDSLYNFFCGHNTNLNCMPQLKRVVNLDFTNTGITCLPNYGTVTTSNPALATVPLCGLFNVNGCSSFSNINGTSYFDSNTDCIQDSIDIPQQNMHIMLYQNGNLVQQTFTGGEGKYSFNVNGNFGNYDVVLDTTGLPFSVLCPANDVYTDTISATDSLLFENNFSLICKNGFDAGVHSIVADHFRPAHQTTIHIGAGDVSNFFGVHCASTISGDVTVVLDGPITFVSADTNALVPTTISGDTLTYSIADLGTVDFFHAFNIVVVTDTFAVSGSPVCVTVSLSPTTGDNDTTNNVLTHCFAVQASFDPNDKEVDPISDIDIHGNKWLTYTIHFQNTGTASAENIYLLDTLDANLDLSTFQLLAYSHQPTVQILDGGIARFNFPNINLADSNSNEPASHGYVQYKIKLKNSVIAGMHLRNTAYIYFDFNSPVATNTVVSNVMDLSGINSLYKSEDAINIYPNPTTGEFNLSFANHIGEKAALKIYNLLGENIFEKQFIVSSSLKINHAEINFHKGIYVVEVAMGNYSEKKKLIVE